MKSLAMFHFKAFPVFLDIAYNLYFFRRGSLWFGAWRWVETVPAFPGRRRCGKQKQEQTRSDRERRRATESARHGSRGIMGTARDRPPFHPGRALFRLHFRKAGPPQQNTTPAFSRPQRIAGSVRRLRRFGRPGEFPPKPPPNNAAPAARPLL